MMDVSGSMTDEQKEIVRTEAFWIDTWLKSQYDGVETRYIIHDAVAKEVDEHTFYHTRESGGTRISSAYKPGRQDHRRRRFPPVGLEHLLLPVLRRRQLGRRQPPVHRAAERAAAAEVNLFGYGQVESPYGSGEFYRRRSTRPFGEQHERSSLSEIEDKEGDLRVDQEVFGQGT